MKQNDYEIPSVSILEIKVHGIILQSGSGSDDGGMEEGGEV